MEWNGRNKQNECCQRRQYKFIHGNDLPCDLSFMLSLENTAGGLAHAFTIRGWPSCKEDLERACPTLQRTNCVASSHKPVEWLVFTDPPPTAAQILRDGEADTVDAVQVPRPELELSLPGRFRATCARRLSLS